MKLVDRTRRIVWPTDVVVIKVTIASKVTTGGNRGRLLRIYIITARGIGGDGRGLLGVTPRGRVRGLL